MSSRAGRRSREQVRAAWSAHIEAWRSQGTPIAAYCRAHRLGQVQFHYWRRRLGAGPEAGDGEATGFVRVSAVGGGGPLVLEWGTRQRLHLPRDLDEEALARVLRVTGAAS